MSEIKQVGLRLDILGFPRELVSSRPICECKVQKWIRKKYIDKKDAFVVSVFPVPAGPAGAPPRNMPRAWLSVT